MTATARILRALEQEGQLVALPPDPVPEIHGVADDSRQVGPGLLFCAILGTSDDGHRYLEDARARGAAAALVSRPAPAVALPQVTVRDGRVAAALAAREWYGRPTDAMELIVGVTGTNGKSTTVSLLRHLLNEEGTAGSLGTLGARDGEGVPIPGFGTLTTPGAVELQAALAALRARGVRRMVLEASSHALDQRRLETVAVHGAVYTNLSHDHLDYHGTLESYAAAKSRLSDHLVSGGVEAVNADDPAWVVLRERSGIRRVRYGEDAGADLRVLFAQPGESGGAITMQFGEEVVAVHLPLVGRFNVSNAAAAAAAAWALGMPPGTIGHRLESAPQVPGRMERLPAPSGVTIVRDYAHTPGALERVLDALRPLIPGRLIVLFGAGGDRDRRKRPLMGAVVARGADLAVVTSDNPRTEDPECILDEIEAGMGTARRVRLVDRREAIRHAVGLLRPGDCLLLAGKGHETHQVIGSRRVPLDERAIVEDILRERAPV